MLEKVTFMPRAAAKPRYALLASCTVMGSSSSAYLETLVAVLSFAGMYRVEEPITAPVVPSALMAYWVAT